MYITRKRNHLPVCNQSSCAWRGFISHDWGIAGSHGNLVSTLPTSLQSSCVLLYSKQSIHLLQELLPLLQPIAMVWYLSGYWLKERKELPQHTLSQMTLFWKHQNKNWNLELKSTKLPNQEKVFQIRRALLNCSSAHCTRLWDLSQCVSST